MPSSTRSRGDQLDRVVSQLFVAVESMRTFYVHCAAQFDLTPPQARVLLMAGQPCSQRHLATQFACDASNIVGIVDRLEQRGLVSRQASSLDRRVKQVMLTAAGEQMRRAFQAQLQEQVPVLSQLDDDELARFEHLLAHFAQDA